MGHVSIMYNVLTKGRVVIHLSEKEYVSFNLGLGFQFKKVSHVDRTIHSSHGPTNSCFHQDLSKRDTYQYKVGYDIKRGEITQWSLDQVFEHMVITMQ